jgi:hypothetical protein
MRAGVVVLAGITLAGLAADAWCGAGTPAGG